MLVLGKSMLLLPLLLLLPHNSQGMDGCEGHIIDKDGYMRNDWRCGDKCIDSRAECSCGGEKIKSNEAKFCCASNCTAGSCIRWKKGHSEGGRHVYCAVWSPGNCIDGDVHNLTKSCNGSCNYYRQDEYRNFRSSRSHVAACGDTKTCIKEGEGRTGLPGLTANYKPTICTGDSSCKGELAWCEKEERKEEKCPEGFIRCSPSLGGSKNKSGNGIPGQCIEESKAKDENIFHCVDRNDENPFKAVNGTNQRRIDFGKLKNCNTSRGSPGLECGEEGSSNCIDIWQWCNERFNEDCPVLGEGITTNNPRVCQNITFWQDKPCDDNSWIRCRSGKSGQCVNKSKWGVEGAKFIGKDATCSDNSDKYRPIKEEGDAGGQSSPKVWKTRPSPDYRANYTKDESTQLWMIPESDPFKVPSVTEEYFEKGPKLWIWNEIIGEYERKKDFYSSDDYVKDETTNLMMAAPTEEACKDNDGFVCKVRLGVDGRIWCTTGGDDDWDVDYHYDFAMIAPSCW